MYTTAGQALLYAVPEGLSTVAAAQWREWVRATAGAAKAARKPDSLGNRLVETFGSTGRSLSSYFSRSHKVAPLSGPAVPPTDPETAHQPPEWDGVLQARPELCPMLLHTLTGAPDFICMTAGVGTAERRLLVGCTPTDLQVLFLQYILLLPQSGRQHDYACLCSRAGGSTAAMSRHVRGSHSHNGLLPRPPSFTVSDCPMNTLSHTTILWRPAVFRGRPMHSVLLVLTVDWGGGIAVRNLPHFYRNFSVMPRFKNFVFPLRKILCLPSLLLGTLYVYVFSSVLHVICVAGRFLVLCSQNVIHSGGQSFRQW